MKSYLGKDPHNKRGNGHDLFVSGKVKGIEDIVTDKKTLLAMLPASIRNKLLEMTRLFTYLENLNTKGKLKFSQVVDHIMSLTWNNSTQDLREVTKRN